MDNWGPNDHSLPRQKNLLNIAENSIMSKAWWSEESVEMAQKQKSVSRGEDYIYQDCRAAMQTETGSEKDNSQKAGLARKERKSGGNLNNKRINVWNRTKEKKKSF